MNSANTKSEWAKAIGDKSRVGCMHDILTEVAQKHADDVAVVCPHYPADLYALPESKTASKGHSDPTDPGQYLRWTHCQVQRVSHIIATALYQKGIRPGMTIAIFPIVGVEFQIIVRSAWELGCTVASMDAACINNPREVQHMLGCTKPSVVLVPTSESAHKIGENAKDILQSVSLKVLTSHTESPNLDGWSNFQELFNYGLQHQELQFSDIQRHLDDEILIIFTSGTTSLPKGCVHTNRSASASCLARSENEQIDSSCVTSAHSPLFHAIGILLALSLFPHGGTVVHPAAKFSPVTILEAIEKEKITHMVLVSTMVNLIIEHPKLATTDTSSLDKVRLGGGNVLPRHCQDSIDSLKANQAHAVYGMSEMWYPASYPPGHIPDPSRPEVGNGYVMPGAALKICAPNSTTLLKRGEAGELHLGGDMLIKRYIGVESQPFYEDEDGKWFPTGDQAVMGSDGDLYITGRYKELIIRGGHNIAPAAIENVFSEHARLQCAVVGVPDETAGEVPIAVVKGKDLTQDDMDELRQVATDKLGSAYAPEKILDLKELDFDDFPRTTSNKMRRMALKPVVQAYLNAKEKEENTTAGDPDLEGQLCNLWSKVLGYGNITPQTNIGNLADSLVLSRARTLLRKNIGANLTIEELAENDTVAKQVRLLESRTKSSDNIQNYEDLLTNRKGPPQAEDMIHTHGCEDRTRMTKERCEQLLKPLGLGWNDVEDVYPMPDLMKIWAQPLRKQSANQRHTLVVDSNNMQHVRTALEKVLALHSVLRSVSIEFDPDTALYGILRATETYFSICITMFEEHVQKADDLQHLLLNDEKHDCATPPGPLIRFLLVPVKDTQQTGLLFFGHHSCLDALSNVPFYEDLDKALSGESDSIPQRVPFKPWADQYFSNQTSLPAKLAVDFHVRRLTGISASKNALFPRQKAAEWFKGHHFGWTPDPSIHKDKDMIQARLNQQTHVGVQGLTSTLHLPNLQHLKQTHNIEAAILLKAVLALINVQETHSHEALFASYQAGRNWPFTPTWMQKQLPPAMDIAGPTLQIATERIAINRSQTVLSLLQHLAAEQQDFNKHTHAPLLAIRKALPEQDAEVMESIRRRQIFNWLPRTGGDEYVKLRRVQLWSRTDVGLLWNCSAVGEEEIKIHVSWDDAQLSTKEVEGLLKRFGQACKILSSKQNWEKKMEEVVKLPGAE